jgi:hypothetical protein
MGANVRHLLAAATGVMIAPLSCSRMPNNPSVFEPIILFDARHLNTNNLACDFRFLPNFGQTSACQPAARTGA